MPFSDQNPLLSGLAMPQASPERSTTASLMRLSDVNGDQAKHSTHPTLTDVNIHAMTPSGFSASGLETSGIAASHTMTLGTPTSQSVTKGSQQALSIHRAVDPSMTASVASSLTDPSLPQPTATASPSKNADFQSLMVNMQPTSLSTLPMAADLAQNMSNVNGANVAAPPTNTVQVSAEWAPVRVDTQAGKWGEQMMQVLQDRITLQANQSLQEARIRLDPPELGKLDVIVRMEGDRLSVQLNASAVATRDALVQVSDRLRAELQNDHFVHVDVNVGAEQQGQKRQDNDDAQQGIFAARDIHAESDTHTFTSEHWLNVHA
ncbi:flagellar hook-length control protein FliK [Enterovibrio nigricans]|nr:flagellar hook-length control protein FliK [Enterovibrio nigricans]